MTAFLVVKKSEMREPRTFFLWFTFRKKVHWILNADYLFEDTSEVAIARGEELVGDVGEAVRAARTLVVHQLEQGGRSGERDEEGMGRGAEALGGRCAGRQVAIRLAGLRADALEAMIRGGEVHRDAVDASSEHSFTLLMAAAMSGARGACKRLVSLGADASATDARGRTALDLALDYGHDAVADLLARKGAPFGYPEKNKQTRADGAAEHKQQQVGVDGTLMHLVYNHVGDPGEAVRLELTQARDITQT